MDYKRFNDTIIMRIDKGEEINQQIKAIALKERIKLASVSALGAVGKLTIGVYKPKEKKYYSNKLEGDYEIVSLTGTITTMDDKFYSHIHVSVGDEQGNVFGGHLNEAYVSVTCEMVVDIIDGSLDRIYDETLGINLLKF